ncbi:AAA family ATPase [Microcystis aeruginosa CS-558/01A06]|uniref:AAA family ATPase n=1 Tax=Microcystis aeruginosa BLCC-F108 TaxID=2755317 RepID=A0A841UJW1_MICAE|nr:MULTISPECIES: AAA family ATPase [Microcystis]MBC1189394.1 AAA family ATPase [Microcystis aeruginosa BLCC-F108]MCA2591018.1 AAA family ATPase [Microcystis sp. M31BS1]MDB9409243.1 AAA family ATPase [Microcystis aeruginosa CS-558/01A06]
MTFNPRHCHNEREVESKLIVQYLLPKLGYNPEHWYQQVSFGKVRLDFLVSAQKPINKKQFLSSHCLIVEAKNPREKLINHRHRLGYYLNYFKVQWGLLTNGDELQLYRRKPDKIYLVFRCSGLEIASHLEQLKSLIGYETLSLGIPPLNSPIINHRNPMKTIAIYHHKGGVGKTTVATNLAAALSKKGKRVLLIDIDAQANSTFAVGLIKFQFDDDDDLKDKNVFHLLNDGDITFVQNIVRKSQGFNHPEIDVIPAHISLIEKQTTLTRYGSSDTRLSKKLDKVRDDYDLVIIDTPPSLDFYAQAGLIASDYLIIPSDLKPFSNQGLNSVKNFIKEAINEPRENLGKEPIKILGVLPSKISTNAQYLRFNFPKQKQVIPDKYGLPLMESTISERMPLSRCINQSVPVGDLEIPAPQSIMDYAENQGDAGVSAAEFEALAIEVLAKIGVK